MLVTKRHGFPVMAALLIGLSLLVAACGGSGATPTARATPTQAPTPTTAPGPTQAPSPTATPVPTPTPRPAPLPSPTPIPTPNRNEPKYGGVLSARMSFTPFSLDTYTLAGSSSQAWLQQNLNNLIAFDRVEPNKIFGDLAQRWEVSSDGKAVTFFLRQGVKYHDGTAFGSKDAVYNLTRAWKPPAPTITYNLDKMKFVQKIDSPDNNTVVLTLTRPSASFLKGLASSQFLMYPSHITDMKAWEGNQVGTGPFKTKFYKGDDRLEFARNDDYWEKDQAGRRLPYLDGVTYFVIPDRSLALSAFRSGRIKGAIGYDGDFLTTNQEEVKRSVPGVQLFLRFTARHDLYFNNRGAYADQRVRQAISIGLDRPELIRSFYGGLSYGPASQLYPPELGGEFGLTKDEMLQTPGFRVPKDKDLARAKELLADAGFKPGQLKPKLLWQTGTYAEEGEAVAPRIEATTGGPLNYVLTDRLSYNAAFTTGDFDITAIFHGIAFDDPADNLVRYVQTGSGTNYGKWSNPQIDALLEQQDLELDQAKRKAMLFKLQRDMLEWSPMVPLLYIAFVWGVWPEVRNYVPPTYSWGTNYRAAYLWLES